MPRLSPAEVLRARKITEAVKLGARPHLQEMSDQEVGELDLQELAKATEALSRAQRNLQAYEARSDADWQDAIDKEYRKRLAAYRGSVTRSKKKLESRQAELAELQSQEVPTDPRAAEAHRSLIADLEKNVQSLGKYRNYEPRNNAEVEYEKKSKLRGANESVGRRQRELESAGQNAKNKAEWAAFFQSLD